MQNITEQMFVQLLSLQNDVRKELTFVKGIFKKMNRMESDIEDTRKAINNPKKDNDKNGLNICLFKIELYVHLTVIVKTEDCDYHL